MKCKKCKSIEATIHVANVGDFCLDCHNDYMVELLGVCKKEESGKMLLTNAVEIGRRLTEAKELLPHGEWLKWLTGSVSYPRSTACRLMKTFREYGPILSAPDEEESSNVAPVHHLNYTQGLILFGIPVEDRDQFIADNDVGNERSGA